MKYAFRLTSNIYFNILSWSDQFRRNVESGHPDSRSWREAQGSREGQFSAATEHDYIHLYMNSKILYNPSVYTNAIILSHKYELEH